LDRYPVATSDILAHLLQEHQVGFVNRAIKATYDTRGSTPENVRNVINKHADTLVKYLLFADEAPLPKEGMTGDAALTKFFLARARKTPAGASLRELDLKTRMFKHRCSYMIHSAAFTGLPAALKTEVLKRLHASLTAGAPHGKHLPVAEKQVIHQILTVTFPPYAKAAAVR